MAYKNGSITIMILLVMTGSTLIVLIALKSAIACYELALERTEHIRQEKALEALLFYGIARGHELKDTAFDQWPPLQGIYQGKLTSMLHQKNIVIQAQLLQNDKIVMTRIGTINHDLNPIDGHA